MFWYSPKDIAKLTCEHFPVTDRKIREWCEAGDIPPTIAKRDKTKAQAPWAIKVTGLVWIMKTLMELTDTEIQEVKAKANLNFNVLHAA